MEAGIPYLRGFLDQSLQEKGNDSSYKMSRLQGCNGIHILASLPGLRTLTHLPESEMSLMWPRYWHPKGPHLHPLPAALPHLLGTTKSSLIL